MFVSQRQWWLYILAAFPAHVIAEHGVGMPIPQMLVAFITNCMVVLLNAYAVRRFVGDRPWFGGFREAMNYIVITGAIGPGLSAFGGALVPILGGGAVADYWIFYAQWYLANALPNLTLGPVLLIWCSDRANWTDWKFSREYLEPFVIAAALIATCISIALLPDKVIHTHFEPAILLLPLPIILWASARFGEKGASGAILIVAVFMTWRALRDVSSLPHDGPYDSVLAVQIFLLGISIPILLLGAAIDELRRAEGAMRNLAASTLRVQDDERRRIARDLHDSTGQNLIAATLVLGEIQRALPVGSEPAAQKLDDLLQASIREIRTVSYLLHPPLLDEAGLDLAVRDYVQGYVDRSEIKVDLQIASDLNRLPSEVELVLFRVMQEALTNVARHSKSDIARIEIKRVERPDREYVILTIEDAGTGMGNAARRTQPGVGLTSMSERVRQVGGEIDIESTVGRTVVTATIPLRE
jgi:signal transduction histidine kinase